MHVRWAGRVTHAFTSSRPDTRDTQRRRLAWLASPAGHSTLVMRASDEPCLSVFRLRAPQGPRHSFGFAAGSVQHILKEQIIPMPRPVSALCANPADSTLGLGFKEVCPSFYHQSHQLCQHSRGYIDGACADTYLDGAGNRGLSGLRLRIVRLQSQPRPCRRIHWRNIVFQSPHGHMLAKEPRRNGMLIALVDTTVRTALLHTRTVECVVGSRSLKIKSSRLVASGT